MTREILSSDLVKVPIVRSLNDVNFMLLKIYSPPFDNFFKYVLCSISNFLALSSENDSKYFKILTV